MLIFPILYISTFLAAIKDIFRKNPQGGLLFLIFGLSIYNTTLSITFAAGLKSYIPFLQPAKELVVLTMLGMSLWQFKSRFRFHVVDYCVAAYLLYTGMYVLLPLGDYGFGQRLLAYKSTSFIGFIYAAGRLINIRTLEIKKYYHLILLVAICAAAVVIVEFLRDEHLQSSTGYSEYIYEFFGQEPEGNYGLTWTFERSESGVKRLASFFSDPLEHASATLLSLSVIAALFTRDNNRFEPSNYGLMGLAASVTSIILSISRSSMASFFVVIYVYALITKRRYILHSCHAIIALAFVYIGILFADTDIADYIISTLTLQDASGYGHLVEWLTGIATIISNPFGLGLGMSGRVAASLGTTVSGENQFIILGVQTGIITVILYVFTHFALIYYSYKWFPRLKGKERMVALSLFLLKVGITLPLITANLDSYSYITYMNWFISGVFINMIMRNGDPDPTVRNYAP